MVTYRELLAALRRLEISRSRPVIVHASLSAFGEVQGGAETLLGALLAAFDSLVMPAFTFRTMLTPEAGPPGNALDYGSGRAWNAQAEFFRPDMPADRLVGKLAETLRCHPQAQRSTHPILSFAGIEAQAYLRVQTREQPLAPIGALASAGGWTLLLGVDHTANTSIHYAERLAGRPGFIRWALTPRGVSACPGFPGCSNGFGAIADRIAPWTRRSAAGRALLQAAPLPELLDLAQGWIRRDPLALLCDSPSCEHCQATRQAALQDK